MEILTIILTILKWIGILLLALLGLVLFLVLFVLLCPIQYRAEGSYDGTPYVKAKVSLFLGLIKARVSYEDSLRWSVKLLSVQLLPKKEKADAGENDAAAKKAGAEPGDKTDGKLPETAQPAQTTAWKAEENAAGDAQTATQTADTAAESVLTPENDSTSEPEGEHAGIFEKIASLLTKWKSKIQDICDKIKGIRDNIDYYKRLLQREEVKNLLGRALRMLGKMLKHIRPRKLQVVAHIGMEDPATTGQIMAIQGILYPWLAKRVVIYPYFEEKKLEGHFVIAGHTVLAVLLVLALRIVLNKDCLAVIRLLRKKEGAKNGRA